MRTLSILLICVHLGHGLAAQDLAGATSTPEDAIDVLFQAGEKAYHGGDYNTAIARYSEVLERDSDHLNAYLQRGFCHTLLREYEAAVRDLSAVIARKSDHVWAYTSRGSAYNKLEQYDKAIADFDRVLSLDPTDQEAFNNRGWSYKGKGDMKAACRDWKESRKMGNAEAKIILSNNRCK